MTAGVPERPGAFFGRRKGKALRAGQAERSETLLPRLKIDLETPAPGHLSELFPHKPAEVFLEIGFGGGEHLLSEAKRLPATGFIGVEPFINGMAKALAGIEAGGIENIRLYDDDATHLLNWLPDQSLGRVDLLYPDPWPKKRHWKRRFVSDSSVAHFARVLRRGGTFRFASDIDTYVEWTLEHVGRNAAFRWTASGLEACREPWEHWRRTRYEAKAVREGRELTYLVFERR
ncbi:tRNA (guanine-N(7)-)-methyltransferase [Agaricicola taiwanensis]|uniref:tRNA (guanine-N(7)-)-methyltransferase n=1 Tax=Agaricicola taiwanensis TaxID=591372 RepID=A0A8J2VKY2_9RHOB|nr:tRNA (guanosine(46)-N7)-methyltransferase TrmB [Agaricicola taiwanensis]GGE29243.1 tRNA (guanine-N(7)-)-methyltransferase [Agaricicola taiwanensis]